jgi:hypothetical protein
MHENAPCLVVSFRVNVQGLRTWSQLGNKLLQTEAVRSAAVAAVGILWEDFASDGDHLLPHPPVGGII